MVHAEFCVNETGALLHCTTLPIWSLVWRGSLVPLSQLTLTESLWLARWVHITQYNGLSASQCILISSFSSRSVLQLALRFSFSFSMQIRIRRTRYKDLCVDNIQRNVRSLGKCRNSRTVEFTIFVLNWTELSSLRGLSFMTSSEKFRFVFTLFYPTMSAFSRTLPYWAALN